MTHTIKCNHLDLYKLTTGKIREIDGLTYLRMEPSDSHIRIPGMNVYDVFIMKNKRTLYKFIIGESISPDEDDNYTGVLYEQ